MLGLRLIKIIDFLLVIIKRPIKNPYYQIVACLRCPGGGV
jgi:hypothetical protein